MNSLWETSKRPNVSCMSLKPSQPWRSNPRTSLGRTRHPQERPPQRPTNRVGYASGLGPCGVHQTRPINARTKGLRHATSASSPVPDKQDNVQIHRLEVQPEMPDNSFRKNSKD